MLRNAAILKIASGIVALGGTAGTGYFVHSKGVFSKELEMFEDETATKYLIVKSVALNADEEKGGVLYEKRIFSNITKKFMCSLKNTESNKEDKTCEIYKLSQQEKDLSEIITNNLSVNSSNLKKNDNYFKLKVSDDFIKEIKKWGDATETIDIVSLDESNKKIGKLIPIYLVDNNEIIKRKTSLIFAKSTTTNSDASSANATNTNKNYECKTTSPESKFDCLVSEVTFNQKKVNIITPPINPTQGELTNLKTQNKYFVIEMDETHLKKFLSTENSNTNLEIVSKTENSKKYSDLTPLFKIFGKEVFGKDHYWLLVSNPTAVYDQLVKQTNWKDNYKTCWISGQKSDCELYKFTSTQSIQSKDLIDFSSGLKKVEKHEELKAHEAYALKVKKNMKNMDVSQVTILLQTTANGCTNYRFDFKNMFFADTTGSGDTLTVNAAFILDL